MRLFPALSTHPSYAAYRVGLGRRCVVPHEMLDWLLAGMRMLQKEAEMICEESKPLDADTMFPILIYAMAHSQLPFMHACVFLLRNFGVKDAAGEAGASTYPSAKGKPVLPVSRRPFLTCPCLRLSPAFRSLLPHMR